MNLYIRMLWMALVEMKRRSCSSETGGHGAGVGAGVVDGFHKCDAIENLVRLAIVECLATRRFTMSNAIQIPNIELIGEHAFDAYTETSRFEEGVSSLVKKDFIDFVKPYLIRLRTDVITQAAFDSVFNLRIVGDEMNKLGPNFKKSVNFAVVKRACGDKVRHAVQEMGLPMREGVSTDGNIDAYIAFVKDVLSGVTSVSFDNHINTDDWSYEQMLARSRNGMSQKNIAFLVNEIQLQLMPHTGKVFDRPISEYVIRKLIQDEVSRRIGLARQV